MATSTETIGRFTFSVDFREPTSESQARFDQRVETLATWLVAQWRKEQKEVDHGDHSQAG